MYCAKNGNYWYTEKIIGEETGIVDKWLLGVSIMVGLLLITVGPLYLFSNLSDFVAPNPIHNG